MDSNVRRGLPDPPSLVQALKAAATQSALANTRSNLSSASVEGFAAAAACVALEVCEKTAVLLRAQLHDSGDPEDATSPPPAKRRRAVERGEDGAAAASSTSASSTGSVRTISTDSAVSRTKKVHTQLAGQILEYRCCPMSTSATGC